MPRAGAGPDFIEALARGLEVIAAFRAGLRHDDARRGRRGRRAWPGRPPAGSCSRWPSSATSASQDGGYALTPRVLDLGVAYVRSQGLWDVARPHMQALVARTHESCSVAQLDGSDIVYVARVAVPKIVGLSVQIGTRFPALPTSLGKVLLAALPAAELEAVLAQPTGPASSRAGSPTGPSATRRCARCGPAAGRSPTSSSPSASARWPPRCATAPAG